MVVNRLDKLFITSDAATIIQELEVVHPAAKLLVMASQQQEAEAGDGTNYVIIFASELLQKAEYLLRMGLHPSEIAQGYELALEKSMTLLEELVVDQVTDLKDVSQVSKVTRTSIAPKEFGYQEFLGDLVAEAVVSTMPSNPQNFNVDNVRVVKILGGNLMQSSVVSGMVFPREPESTVKCMSKAKIAVYSCPFDIGQTETKGTVLLKSAKEILDYTKGEENQMEQVVSDIIKAGINVVACGSTVGDLALHYLNQNGILVIKFPSKFELRRVCRLTGANAMARLGAPSKEEVGFIDQIVIEEIGSDRVTVFRNLDGDENNFNSKVSTIVLRGATQNYLDDIERAIDDGVNVVKALTKDSRLVAGATATEMELNKLISNYADSTSSTNQYAIRKFAESFEVFSRTISDNCGLDSTDLVSRLIAAHHKISPESGEVGEDLCGASIGINVESESSSSNGGLIDAVKANILEPLAVKQWAIRYATQAALTVLQVDQIIMAKKAGGPKPPSKQGHWDDDD
ncbi:putative T-complex protein 1 subunit theta [Smittium mucronatum]|uniref:CCT-theta n=1 Tax=Smittium mucronatum TaxID=133383 RepID=A0A1R0H2D0_9FUNG|nr:putative T-complex protein 1 subunit theta [Smittium mucronatum]